MLQNHLKEAIRRKRRGLLFSGVCLQHDNGRPHTACHTVKQILDLNMAVLRHPPYSPDLALRDFHFFWTLKDAVRGRHIRSDEVVKKAMQDWLSQQPKYVSSRGIYTLLELWSRSVEGGGNYTED